MARRSSGSSACRWPHHRDRADAIRRAKNCLHQYASRLFDGCVFCATGQTGLARNLTAARSWRRYWPRSGGWSHHPTDNRKTDDGILRSEVVVVCRSSSHQHRRHGMGEPLANYDRTWAALRRITDRARSAWARDTSPCRRSAAAGILRWRRAAADHLAVSLHARTMSCAPSSCRSITAIRSLR